MLETFVLRWGYVAVGVGTFFEGETVLVVAGAFAHKGLLSLPLVIVSAFVGSVTGDQLWFRIGRRFGRPVIDRRERWKVRAARTEAWLDRYGALFVLGFRFVYGIRTVTPLFLGATAYPGRRFAVLNVVGGAAWATALGGAGWVLGASLARILNRAGHIEELVVVALVMVSSFWLVVRLVRRHMATRE